MSLILSYITNNSVLATDKNSECEQFRSHKRQEIKRESDSKREATECSRKKCKTKKSVRRRNKKHSRTSPDAQFNEISEIFGLKKLDLELTMSELGKPCQNAAFEKTTSEK